MEAASKVVDAEIIDDQIVEDAVIDAEVKDEGFSLRPPVDIWGSFVAGVAEGVRRGLR